MLKHKLFSMLNILGLSIAMAACLLILHYVKFENSYENFHQNAENIFRVTLDSYNGEELVVQDAEMYPLAGPALKDRYPEVLDHVRLQDQESMRSFMFKVGDVLFHHSKIFFADASVFNVFSFDILAGNPEERLQAPWTIVLTRSLAESYFGSIDILGKTVQIKANGELKDLEVVGVIEDSPPNTHIKFNAFISYETIVQVGYKPGWNGNNEFCYLLMAPNTNIAEFNHKLKFFVKEELKGKIQHELFVAERLTDIHLFSHKTYEAEANGDSQIVYFLLLVALFIMVIAWVNYLNLSTARAVARAREVGIRKVMGSSKRYLVGQFLFESALINLISLSLAIGIVLLSLPFFIELSGQALPRAIASNTDFWILLLGLFITGTVLSGFYPALVLSSFQPVTVLKGNLKNSKHGYLLRQGLVVFQFVITVVLIAGTFAVFTQLDFLRNEELGLNMDQVMIVEAPLTLDTGSVKLEKMKVLKNQWNNLADVNSVASTGAIPGLAHKYLNSTVGVNIIGENSDRNNYTYYHFGVDASLISTLGLKLAAGGNFQEKEKNNGQIILNEQAARLIGFKSPQDAIGKRIKFGNEWTVIGVLENYHHHSLKMEVDPFIYWFREYNGYLCLDLKTQNIKSTIAQVEADFKEMYPGSPFNYYFLDDKFNQQYVADQQFGQVFGFFASMAIFIACLGLFGLSSYTVLQRTKEIGVRKVLGASVPNILVLLSKDYLRLLLIAIIVGIPVSNYLIIEWLNNFAARVIIHWWFYVLPAFIVVFIAILAVSSQTLKAATNEPVDALKYE